MDAIIEDLDHHSEIYLYVADSTKIKLWHKSKYDNFLTVTYVNNNYSLDVSNIYDNLTHEMYNQIIEKILNNKTTTNIINIAIKYNNNGCLEMLYSKKMQEKQISFIIDMLLVKCKKYASSNTKFPTNEELNKLLASPSFKLPQKINVVPINQLLPIKKITRKNVPKIFPKITINLIED